MALPHPATQPRSRVERVALSTPFAGGLIALLTWPIASSVPQIGPDASWVAGLYMALGNGLQFGTEFVFAYGPLGFLEQPALYDGDLWIVATLYRGILCGALACALLWSARRAMPFPLAALAVYALLVLGYLEAGAVLLACVVCLAALGDGAPAHARLTVAVGGGALAAVELLGKLNFGIAVLCLSLIALLGLPQRRRYVPLLGTVFAVSTLCLWMATGQALGNLPAFASNAVQVLSGYSSAMATDVSDVRWQIPWAVAAIALLLLAAAAPTARVDPIPRRAARIALVAAFGFFMFKQSFVRQGLGNGSDFFPLMAGAGLALGSQLPKRVWRLSRPALLALLLIPLALLTIAALPRPSLWDSLKPGDHLDFLRQDLRALVSSSERRRLTDEGVARMTAAYRIDRETMALLRERQVAVDPWEIGAAWAYGLDWRPLPVIQDYQAYTPVLDRLNAESLSKPSRPTAILRQNTGAFGGQVDPSIDDRYNGWDPPAASRAMLCHYRPVRTTRLWQVLYPVADRCRAARLIARVRADTGDTIAVPPPPADGIVFARVTGLEVDGLEAIRTFLYRARERSAILADDTAWRVVAATAADGLLLRADRAVDFPPPFGLAPQSRTISLQIAGASERPLEVRFYAQRLSRDGG